MALLQQQLSKIANYIIKNQVIMQTGIVLDAKLDGLDKK